MMVFGGCGGVTVVAPVAVDVVSDCDGANVVVSFVVGAK